MSNVTNVKAKRFTDGTAASTTAVAAAQTLGGAGNLTLAGGATGFGVRLLNNLIKEYYE